MRLCYKEELNSCKRVSDYMLVFCSNNMKSSNVKKEINNILNRKQSLDETNKISLSIDDICSEIYKNDLYLEKLFLDIDLKNYNNIKNMKEKIYKELKEDILKELKS